MRTALATTRTVDPRAYDAYLRGLQLRGTATLIRSWGPAAIEQFERAVALDPSFAEAHAALAFARSLLGIVGYNLGYHGEFSKARKAAQRALEIDDRLGGAHAVKEELEVPQNLQRYAARFSGQPSLDEHLSRQARPKT